MLACVCVCVFVCVCVCVCVCLAPRPLITSHVKGSRNNRIMKFNSYSVSLYDTTVNKLNRRGLSNTAAWSCTPAKEESNNVVLATEGLPGSTNKSERFNYKGE